MAGFNIDEFKSYISKNGLLKDNLYLVNFVQAQNKNGDIPTNLFFYTSSVQIPGVDLSTLSIKRYGYGPTEQYPDRPVFNMLNMTFMVEANQKNVVTGFMSMLTSATNFARYNDMGSIINNQKTYPYEVAYRNTYIFNLEVYVYNEIGAGIMIYEFRNCFAKTVDSINLNWASTDNLLKIGVSFSFTDFGINTVTGSSIDQVQSLLNTSALFGIQTGQLATALYQPQTLNDMINRNNGRVIASTGMGTYIQSPSTQPASSVPFAPSF